MILHNTHKNLIKVRITCWCAGYHDSTTIPLLHILRKSVLSVSVRSKNNYVFVYNAKFNHKEEMLILDLLIPSEYTVVRGILDTDKLTAIISGISSIDIENTVKKNTIVSFGRALEKADTAHTIKFLSKYVGLI
jgi:hypothetical protein